MRTVPAAITAARQSAAASLCKIWRMERVDGTVYRFTEHDRDLEVDGETFVATASFDPSSIKASAGLDVGDLEVYGAFDTSYITERDLLAGLFNGASFWVAEVLWDNPGAGKDVLKFGWIGRVKEAGESFRAELLDPTARLQQPIVRIYSSACDADLGDARCGVDLDGSPNFTQIGTVSAVADNRQFLAAGLSLASGEEDWFQFGRVTWLTGVNVGLQMEVRSCDGANVALMLPMPFEVGVGDTFTITAGCNKTLGVCIGRFANQDNFRGFPHVPVSDDVIKGITPTAVEAADGGTVAPEPTDGEATV